MMVIGCGKDRYGVVLIALFLAVVAVIMLSFISGNLYVEFGHNGAVFSGTTENWINLGLHRKLLPQSLGPTAQPNRLWGEKCTKADIVINQGPTAPLPNGIPTYTVEIMNVCVTGCDISRIHLHCGWFSSARLVNPRIFKRLRYNDCLVNDGKSLINGGALSFEYANTFPYTLSVSSIACH